MPFCEVERLCVQPEAPLREVMERINLTLRGIALVVDDGQRLLGTITDGDIRRAILSNVKLEATASSLLHDRPAALPITAPAGTSQTQLLQVMLNRGVRQVPLLNPDGCVVDLVTSDDLLPTSMAPAAALIMAGGHGVRLRPLTNDVPKPMLPIGGRPLMELTVERLRRAGIRTVHVATHYKSDKIVNHFGNGNEFGVDLNYLSEELPMGTAGALSMLPRSDGPLLVINGDILTDVDFKAMLDFHREHGAAATIAVRKYEIAVPYGVIESEGVTVRALAEKPVLNVFVNAGIYLFEQAALTLVRNGPVDMPEIINRLVGAGRVVVNFPVLEYWMDIGHHEDYARAQEDVKKLR